MCGNDHIRKSRKTFLKQWRNGIHSVNTKYFLPNDRDFYYKERALYKNNSVSQRVFLKT